MGVFCAYYLFDNLLSAVLISGKSGDRSFGSNENYHSVHFKHGRLKSLKLLKQEEFKYSSRTVYLFIVYSFIAWLLNIFSQVIFSSQNAFPFLVRTTILAITDILLVVISIRMLRLNHLAENSLGLASFHKAILNFLFGLCIAFVVIICLGTVLYFFVPFHFVKGALNVTGLLKESSAYFWGNMLEELIFRGFLLVLLIQITGWRKAVWIMAIPFGLFHLPGMGLTLEGLKMVATTAAFSFVFSYAFLLTGSLWTAIGVHVAGNILLHAITGLDGNNKAVYQPVFNGKFPQKYDAGFVASLVTSICVSFILYLLIKRKNQLI